MNITKAILLILLTTLLTIASACKGEKSAAEADDETISPATAPASTDTDAVVTQTTEIGEERSPNEGGVLTDNSPASAGRETGNTVTTTDPNAQRPAAAPAPGATATTT